MQKGQFLLLASLMTVASFLGGTLASITVLKNTKQIIETPALFFVDDHGNQIGGVGFGDDGRLRIMRFGNRTSGSQDAFREED